MPMADRQSAVSDVRTAAKHFSIGSGADEDGKVDELRTTLPLNGGAARESPETPFHAFSW